MLQRDIKTVESSYNSQFYRRSTRHNQFKNSYSIYNSFVWEQYVLGNDIDMVTRLKRQCFNHFHSIEDLNHLWYKYGTIVLNKIGRKILEKVSIYLRCNLIKSESRLNLQRNCIHFMLLCIPTFDVAYYHQNFTFCMGDELKFIASTNRNGILRIRRHLPICLILI